MPSIEKTWRSIASDRPLMIATRRTESRSRSRASLAPGKGRASSGCWTIGARVPSKSVATSSLSGGTSASSLRTPSSSALPIPTSADINYDNAVISIRAPKLRHFIAALEAKLAALTPVLENDAKAVERAADRVARGFHHQLMMAQSSRHYAAPPRDASGRRLRASAHGTGPRLGGAGGGGGLT